MRAKQTVIISKSTTHSRKEAEKIARGYADRIYTSRETGSSFRFRQKPPSAFDPGSFKTKKISKGVSIVYGELKGRK